MAREEKWSDNNPLLHSFFSFLLSARSPIAQNWFDGHSEEEEEEQTTRERILFSEQQRPISLQNIVISRFPIAIYPRTCVPCVVGIHGVLPLLCTDDCFPPPPMCSCLLCLGAPSRVLVVDSRQGGEEGKGQPFYLSASPFWGNGVRGRAKNKRTSFFSPPCSSWSARRRAGGS